MILAPQGMLVMIIPTSRENRQEFIDTMKQLGEFQITEQELNGSHYRKTPLTKSGEREPEKDIFYPLKSVDFRYLEIRFNN